MRNMQIRQWLASAAGCVPIILGMAIFSPQADACVSSAPSLSSGLIGYWSGNGNANDASPTANNGSFAGSYAAGNACESQSFNLGTGIVSMPNNAAYTALDTPSWSVGFWFNTNSIPIGGNGITFIGQDNGGGSTPKWGILYGYPAGGSTNYELHINDYNAEGIWLSSPSMANPTGWNQLTVTVGPSVVDFYLNGNLIGSDATPSYVLQTTAPLDLGYMEACCTFSGLMNEVTIYNRALNSSEVQSLASSTTVPEPAALAVLASGLAAFGMIRRRKHRADRE
jgi:hypothetical protein